MLEVFELAVDVGAAETAQMRRAFQKRFSNV
jgi:hypothetical protein